MNIVSIYTLRTVLWVALGLLQFLLAIHARQAGRAADQGSERRLLPVAVFLASGILLMVGAVRGSGSLVALGLATGVAGPVMFGLLINHNQHPLHHVIRALGYVAAYVLLWRA